MRAILRFALAAVLVSAAALAGGAFWLLGTAGGARFLIAAAARRAPVPIEVERVSGRLAGELRLDSVGVRWPGGEASVATLRLRWRPFALLEGAVSIAALSLDGVTVNLRAQEKTPAPRFEPRWPSVAGLPARLEARVDSLRVSGVTVRRAGAEAAAVTEATARVGWKDGVLSVSGLAVKAGDGTISGSLAAGFVRPSVRAGLAFHGVDFGPLAGVRTDVSGTLHGEGTPQEYAGGFSLQNRGEGVRNLRLAGAFAGDLGKVAVSRIEGNWLDGVVTGKGEASWKDGLAVSGSLAGRSLNPARIRPDWPGRINFEINGSAKKTQGSPVRADVDGRLLSSRLRRRALTGTFRARLDREGLRIARLSLHWDGFDVTAKGRLRDRLDLFADIRRIGGLLPGTEGSAKVDGWIRWRDGAPAGVLSARAKDLHVSAIRLGSFSLAARRAEPDGPFAVHAEGRGVSKGLLRIDFFSLDAAGTAPEHTARLLLRSGSGEADLAARGGYRAGTWEGTVTGLSVRGKEAGEWKVAAPFAIAASAARVKVSPFLATGPGGGSVGANADLALDPLRGTVRVAWKKLDPALADPWLTDVRLSGSSTGEAEIRWTAGGRVALSVRADAAGKLFLGKSELTVGRADADLSWGPDGLSARWAVDLAGSGALRGAVTSGEPARLVLPSRFEASADWRGLDLSLLSAWLPGARITGSCDGKVRAGRRPDGGLDVSGTAELSGRLVLGKIALDVARAGATLSGDERGIRASLDVALAGGGTVTASLTSDRPARAGIPERGRIRLSVESVDLSLLSPWIPERLKAEGTLAGHADGNWFPGGRIALDGEARIASGSFTWRTKAGEASARLRSAALRFAWRGETATGEMALVLEDHGSVDGNFRIPVAARFPIAIRPDGEVRGALTAKLREKGLLSAFFPGMLQESTGEIAVSLAVGGTWSSPAVNGEASLSHAGAYLPAAGIRLEEMEVRADIAGGKVRVRKLEIRSGKGSIEGTASIGIKDWRIQEYEATFAGKNFLALDLPEVRLVASPELSVEGTMRRVKVRGEIRVPELEIRGRQTPPPVPRSEDVIIVDAGKPPTEPSALSLDVSVKVVLEKHVLVKAQGVDARLEGGFTVLTDAKDRMIARGEVRVAQGSYAVYGIRLTITRGTLLFAGTPVDVPTLDFQAIRTVGDVKAGVEVAGTLKKPIVKLYSEPTMEDTDILSYIVLGHPLGQQKEQAEPLMLAAGALLPYGQSAMLQDRLRRRFGLDVIEVKAKGGETAGSVVTIGKYLNPRLYVSYGRSVFTSANEFTVRYDFRKRWQIESQIGEESGVDLFYKIEFR